MPIKFANNAITTLAGSLTNVATSLTVQTGDGAKFPALAGGEFFMLTLVKTVVGVPVYEVVKVTARATDVFTIVRGQEGTTATTFSAGDRAENRLTRDTMENEVTKNASNNTLTGNNNFNGTSTFNNDITVVGGVITEAEGAAVASAPTTDIWAGSDGNTKHITGTTTITSFGTAPQAGAWMKVIFDAALTLTHSANLNLNNNGSNVTVAAGDMAMVYADTTTQMDVFIQRANGLPVATIPQSALVLLATLTPAVAATLDALNVFTSQYDNYLIIGDGLLPSANDSLSMRFANAGAVDTGSKYYGGTPGGATDTTTATSMFVSGASILSTGKGGSFTMQVMNANDAVNAKCSRASNITQVNATPGYNADETWGAYDSANAISGIRFFWTSASNFQAAGKIRIYGISNS